MNHELNMKPSKQKFFLVNDKIQLIHAPSKSGEMNDSPKGVSSCLTLRLNESMLKQMPSYQCTLGK